MPRLASAICVAPTILAKIEQRAYKSEILVFERESMLRRADWFKSGVCPLMANHFSKGRRIFLAEKVKSKLFAPGEVIYKEGDKVDTMFIVRYGKCIARKNLKLKQEGVEFPYGITLAEFNPGDYFGDEIAVGAEERLLRIFAGSGGAEVIVILANVAQDIFTARAWESIREQHNALLLETQKRYDESMAELRNKRLNYDLKKNALSQRYQHRAGYANEYATTVDVLLELENTRDDKVHTAYIERMGRPQNQDTHVTDVKRKEEEAWRVARAEKIRRANKIKAYDEDEFTEEELAVEMVRQRPSTSEIRASTDELKMQLSNIEMDAVIRYTKESSSKNIQDIIRRFQEMQHKMEAGGGSEGGESSKSNTSRNF